MATAAGRKSMSRILLSSFRGTYNELRPMAEGDFLFLFRWLLLFGPWTSFSGRQHTYLQLKSPAVET